MEYEFVYHENTPDQDFLDDLKKVALKLGKNKVTKAEYKEYGKFSSGKIERRFGNWTRALKKSGLDLTYQKNITAEELFGNIEEIWITLGRQPLYDDIKRCGSKFPPGLYVKQFGSWRKAIEAFIDFIRKNETQSSEEEETNQHENNSSHTGEKEIPKHKTGRNISSRHKVQVLMRDGNKCKLCGVTVAGDNMHFGHIKPWSEGSKTILENVQVLCAKH